MEALRDIVTPGLLKWLEATQFLVSSAEALHVIAGFWEEALYLKDNEKGFKACMSFKIR